MDIIFQSGEFINNSSNIFNIFSRLVGALFGSLISGLIAVWIYRRGVIQENIRSENKERQEVQRVRKTFFILLESIIKTIKEQVAEYESYNQKIAHDPLENIVPKEYPLQDMDRILKIETSNIIEVFNYLGLQDTEYLSTIQNLDYLNAVNKGISKELNDLKGISIHDMNTTYINTRNEILDICALNLLNIQNSNPDFERNEYYIFLNGTISSYYETNDGISGLQYDQQRLIEPLKDAFIHRFRDQEIVHEVLKKAKKCSDIVFTIGHFNENFSINLRRIIDDINVSIQALERDLAVNRARS